MQIKRTIPFTILLVGAGLSAQAWAPRVLPMLPQAIASFGAARSGNWIYVYGGHIGKRHRHSRDNLVGAFRRLNLCDMRSWEELPGGRALQSVALVAHRGSLIRVGGMTAHNPAGTAAQMESVREVRKYDPVRRRWQELPDLPAPRSSHDALVLGDRLFVVGGWSIQGEAREWHETALCLDLSAGPEARWREIAQPFSRRALVLGHHAGRIFALGGLNPRGKTETRVDVLDPKSGRWERGPELPCRGFGVGCAQVDGRLFVNAWSREVFELREGRWRAIRRLSQGRFFHRMVALGDGRLMALGGAGHAGHSRSVELVDLRSDAIQVSHFEIPYAGDARNRQGVVYHRGRVLLFGGNKSMGQHDFEPEHFSAQVWSLNLADHRLRREADLPSPRQSAVVHRSKASPGEVLAVAGFRHDGEVARCHGEVLLGQLRRRTFSVESARMSPGRTQFGLAEIGEKLFVLGGTDYDPRRGKRDAFRYPLEVLQLNLRAEGRSFVDSGYRLRKPRRAFGGAQLGDHYYLFGGMGPGFALLRDAELVNLRTGEWGSLETGGKARLAPRVVAMGGRFYFAGGRSPAREPAVEAGSIKRRPKLVANPGLEMFDPKRGVWATLIERLPIPTRHIHMIPGEDGQLILLSTHHRSGGRLSVVVVDLPHSAAH